MKGRGKIGARRVVEAMLVVSAVVALAGVFSAHKSATAPERAVEDCEVVGDEHELLVTGYCNCGKCCGWRKKWFFFGEPVYNYGDLKGTPKKVGVTASGAVAAKGTIAADLAVYPLGTNKNQGSRIWHGNRPGRRRIDQGLPHRHMVPVP